ncbi:MAG: hypothetical protein H6739_32355 [Alphaproteobacteria bacterium]|nr:hypothetical protein [Alphaproteobacteria bacterium]
MSAVSTELGLRRAMLAVAVLISVGTLAELLLIGHTESPVQLVPLFMGVLAIGGAVALWLAPSRKTALGVRVLTGALLAGALLGVWEHLEHNYAFEAEIRPTAEPRELAVEALLGANPLLAPGAFAAAALLLGAATWRS